MKEWINKWGQRLDVSKKENEASWWYASKVIASLSKVLFLIIFITVLAINGCVHKDWSQADPGIILFF